MSFSFSRKRLESMLGESIKGIAATAASFIKTEDIALIVANSDRIREKRLAPSGVRSEPADTDWIDLSRETLNEALSAYLRNKNLIANIKKMNNIDSPINIYVLENEKLKMVMTSDEVLLTDAAYLIRPEAREALLSLSPRATAIYKDKDGTWISAYSP